MNDSNRMKNNKIRYLLGIDGGGTRTGFVLSHINVNEIARVVLGCSIPVNIGTENACGIIKEGVLRLCEGIDLSEISVLAGGSESIKRNPLRGS